MTKTKSKGPKIIEQGAEEHESDLDATTDVTEESGYSEHHEEIPPLPNETTNNVDPDEEHAPETRALDAEPHLVVNHGPSADVAKNDAVQPEKRKRQRRDLEGQLGGLRASYAKHVEKQKQKRDVLKTQLEAVELELAQAERQLARISKTLEDGDEEAAESLQRLTPPEPVPSVPGSVPEDGTSLASGTPVT